MKKIIRMALMMVMLCMALGCASKLVRIDSKPAFAEIRINGAYISKTPMYYRFEDRWYPWPIKKTDDYVVQAYLTGYENDVKIFKDTPPAFDISYVPDEIFFTMIPLGTDKTGE
jgi:hypothetical protein